MSDKAFLDTNVVLYAFRQDGARSRQAEILLAAGSTLSVQVLNEFVNVAWRKLNKSWEEVRRALGILRVFCPDPAPVTIETHDQAVHVAERYGYSVFDSLIIATALERQCNILYSEDLQAGHVIEGRLRVENPFI